MFCHYFNGDNQDSNFFESDDEQKQFISYPELNVELESIFRNETLSVLKAEEIFEKAKKEKDIKKLYKALYYNNTNEKIILEILNLENNIKKEEILSKYGYYLSDSNYSFYFNKKKKSIIELYKHFFDLFENFKIYSFKSIETINKFVNEYYLIENRNTFAKENDINEELFANFLDLSRKFSIFFESKKSLIYNDTSLNYDEKLIKYFSQSKIDLITESVGIAKLDKRVENLDFEKIKNDIMYTYLDCFTLNFASISNVVCKLKNEISLCLNEINDINTYILICIKEIILELLNKNDLNLNKEISEKIQKYFLEDSFENDINEFISQFNKDSSIIRVEKDETNKNNLIFSSEHPKKDKIKKILKNIKIYDWERVKNDSFILSINMHIPLEYQFLDFVKIEYLNEFNYYRYSEGFIQELLTKICQSKTIISLLNEIFPGCGKIFNEKSNFLTNLMNKMLQRFYFFKLSLLRKAVTYPEIKKIYFFIINKTTKNVNSMNECQKFFVFNLAAFVYLFFHEFLGHFLLHYLELITKNKYKSPYSKIDKKKESGSFIETKLFGKRVKVDKYSYLLYMLDIVNYKNNYKTFCSNFNNIKTYTPSKHLLDMFKKYFEINLDIRDETIEEKDIASEYSMVNRDNEDFSIFNSTLNDCIPFNNNDLLYRLKNINK